MYVSFDDDDDDDDDYDERERKAAIKSKAETDRDAIRRHKYWCAFSNNLDTVVFPIRHPPLSAYWYTFRLMEKIQLCFCYA